MVKFEENVQAVLPYNWEHYRDWYQDEVESPVRWFGVSFQLEDVRTRIPSSESIRIYKPLVEQVIAAFDKDSKWVANHEDLYSQWLHKGNTLPSLRALFRKNKVHNKFKGSIVFDREDLLAILPDLISYPYALFGEKGSFYSTVDISNAEQPFIIKTTGHATIDLLSSDKVLLERIVAENVHHGFVLVEYR